MKRLLQSHVVEIPGDARDPDFDGMAELWFENMDDLLAARRSPEWKDSTEDDKNFIDDARVAYFVCTEHEVAVRPSGQAS